MLEIVKSSAKEDSVKGILMVKMRPLEVGRVVGNTRFKGHLVARTQDTDRVEIMDLTEPETGGWYNVKDTNEFRVEVLPPGEEVHIKLFNRERT